MLQTKAGNDAAATVVRERAHNACDPGLLADWQSLAEIASEPCAFAEHWFLLPALAQFGHDGIKLLEVRALTGELIGMIALESHDRYGRIPVRHIRNWVHYQCFMGTPLVRAGSEQLFWRAVLGWLDRSDWADGFLTLREMAETGALTAALSDVRACDIVHQYRRAMLSTRDSPEAYLDANIRPKKRKELRRLAARLQDMGQVTYEILSADGPLDEWSREFLDLEQSGWKGAKGAALANAEPTRVFLTHILSGAHAAKRLDFQRLCLDGRPIAMLINFRTPPGSSSFKIAFDEGLARFSPGVMIEIENLRRAIDDAEIEWMDSCAVAGHPMIDKIWAERRGIVQLTVHLSGVRRRVVHAACRATESASSVLRRLRA